MTYRLPAMTYNGIRLYLLTALTSHSRFLQGFEEITDNLGSLLQAITFYAKSSEIPFMKHTVIETKNSGSTTQQNFTYVKKKTLNRYYR